MPDTAVHFLMDPEQEAALVNTNTAYDQLGRLVLHIKAHPTAESGAYMKQIGKYAEDIQVIQRCMRGSDLVDAVNVWARMVEHLSRVYFERNHSEFKLLSRGHFST